MNEYIREFINQVGTDVSGKWLSVDKTENLIELVVSECCKQFTDDEAVTGAFLKKRLKEHFGVEE